jgi:RND family efflux transporter MFP subunit
MRHRQAIAAALFAASCARPVHPPTDAVIVQTLRVGRSDATSTVRTSGEVRARVESNLSFRASGKVVARLVDTGDRVRAGSVLARLDPEEPRADLSVASATLASAQATMDRSKLNLDRARALFSDAAIARAALDSAERDVAVSASSLASAKARFEIARDALSYTELRATRDGVVTARTLAVGQVAQEGATAFTVAEDGKRDAVFDIDEHVADRVAIGTPLSIALADDPHVVANGVVREIAPAVDPGTASVRIKVAVDDPLPAGMTLGAPVVGSLALTSAKTFTIPSESIFSDDTEAPAVWVLDPHTKAVTLRRVVVQSYDSRNVVVQDGLGDGDVIVTGGASRLRPSQVVRPANGDPS